MNVLNKFLILVLMLLNINLVFSFNICGVSIEEPWFSIKDNTGEEVLIIDNEGDIYAVGQDHSLNNVNDYESIKIDDMHFNTITSKYSSLSQEAPSVSLSNSLIIRSDLGTDVASLSGDTIMTVGKAAVEGEQAGCLVDGSYCNGDVVENRNYYCNIAGSKNGSCDNNVLSSEDCSTKLSTDSDSGDNIYTQGTLIDYITCSNANPSSYCTYDTYTDYCQDSSNLIEYSTTGSSHNLRTVNEDEPNFNYCTADKIYYHQVSYDCVSGKFSQVSDQVIDTCLVDSPDYSAWSCSDINTRVRTKTTYYPECSVAGGCSQSDIDTLDYVSCTSSQYCGSGSCLPIVNCVGSWSDTSTCSASCGGGVKQQVYHITTPASPKGASCPYSEGATRWGTTSCNTQSCGPVCGSSGCEVGETCASCPTDCGVCAVTPVGVVSDGLFAGLFLDSDSATWGFTDACTALYNAYNGGDITIDHTGGGMGATNALPCSFKHNYDAGLYIYVDSLGTGSGGTIAIPSSFEPRPISKPHVFIPKDKWVTISTTTNSKLRENFHVYIDGVEKIVTSYSDPYIFEGLLITRKKCEDNLIVANYGIPMYPQSVDVCIPIS